MSDKKPYTFNISFPGNLEYVSPIRKFISEVLVRKNFTQKFAYRSEVIIDEICSNAVNYGCKSANAKIEFLCSIYEDKVDILVRDEGGKKKDVETLRLAVNGGKEKKVNSIEPIESTNQKCLGLEIVKMLSERIDLEIDDNNVTTIRVVRKRQNLKNN